MAGYFARLWTEDGLEVHKFAKKRIRPISSHLYRINLVSKGFVTWLSGSFSCGTRRVVPRGKIAPSYPLE